MGLILLQGAQIGAGAEPPSPLTLTTAPPHLTGAGPSAPELMGTPYTIEIFGYGWGCGIFVGLYKLHQNVLKSEDNVFKISIFKKLSIVLYSVHWYMYTFILRS